MDIQEFLSSEFDWGEIYEPTNFVAREIFSEKVYDYWRTVEDGDIVVDIGSSVGPFAYKSLQNNIKKIYCVEPSKSLIQTNIKNLSKFFINSLDNPITFINYAISDENNEEINESSLYDIDVYGEDKKCKTMTFDSLVEKYKINKINFLKIDCEGGEYSIFNEKNLNYIKNNVEFVACEVHVRNIKNGMEKFINLRDNFLKNFSRDNYKFMCYVDNVYDDVTDWIFTEFGCDYFLKQVELMLYINNK